MLENCWVEPEPFQPDCLGRRAAPSNLCSSDLQDNWLLLLHTQLCPSALEEHREAVGAEPRRPTLIPFFGPTMLTKPQAISVLLVGGNGK